MKTIEELEAELETVTRERDKLSVLVELSDGYRRERDEARAEVQRFRDWYRNAFGGPSKRETPWDPCACDECESLRRLKDEQPVHPSNLTDVVSLLEDERDELLVRVANQDAELRATRESYNGARAEVAQDIHLACLDARRDEREMIASWLSAEIHRLPVYQPSYGPKELRARSRALEGAACAVRSCAHVPRVEDDDA